MNNKYDTNTILNPISYTVFIIIIIIIFRIYSVVSIFWYKVKYICNKLKLFKDSHFEEAYLLMGSLTLT